MSKTLFEANSSSKKVKALGVELTIELSKVKIVVNGVELNDFKIDDLKIIAEE